MSTHSLGRHILVELMDCDPELVNDVVHTEESMVGAARHAEATVINSTFHHFSPFGVSGVVVIQESHLAIHTWPEYGYAAIDLFTCGDVIDPWICYRYLEKAFKAGHGTAMELLRGQPHLFKTTDFDASGLKEGVPAESVRASRDVWFTERGENIALSLKHSGKRLFMERTPYQKVEIYDTEAYGKLLALDGMIMTTEKDEYGYHEMIVHPALQTHPEPKRVLIIGGGDGGAAREALRYESVEQVVMVEIDGVVIEASKEFLPKIAASFGDPRLQVEVTDGIAWVEAAADESFDVVLVDSTDPIGPAEGLFSVDFYRHVHRLLRPAGIMVVQSESPRFNTKTFREIFTTHRGIFGKDRVFCYLAFIPTYPSGMWSFAYATKDGLHPVEAFDDAASAGFADQHGLQYYNAEIHRAAFALPGFVKGLLEG